MTYKFQKAFFKGIQAFCITNILVLLVPHNKGWYLKDSPPLLSIYVQNSSTPLTLDVQFQPTPPSPPLQMINNQLKENITQGWLCMLSGPCSRSAFVFNINSLILSGFPLTYFHLAEAGLCTFSWLYALACVVVQKYHEMSFIYNHSHSWYLFCNQRVLFARLENVNKLWSNNRTVHVNERNQNKTKTKSRHIQIDHAFYCSI